MRAMSPKPDDRFPALADLLTEMEGQERKVAVGLGGLLMIAAGVAAAATGAYFFLKPAAPPRADAKCCRAEPEKEAAVEQLEAEGARDNYCERPERRGLDAAADGAVRYVSADRAAERAAERASSEQPCE